MKTRLVGKTPAVAIVNPKFDHNVGGALRACSRLGAVQLWYTGERVPDVSKQQQLARRQRGGPGKKYRLPREQRMKDYRNVEIFRDDRFFDHYRDVDVTPVAVEIRPGSELLPQFEHPENPLYVFGPEDGSLTNGYIELCHRFVAIPSRGCLNLAAAINVVLYDRLAKLGDYELWQAMMEERGVERGSPWPQWMLDHGQDGDAPEATPYFT